MTEKEINSRLIEISNLIHRELINSRLDGFKVFYVVIMGALLYIIISLFFVVNLVNILQLNDDLSLDLIVSLIIGSYIFGIVTFLVVENQTDFFRTKFFKEKSQFVKTLEKEQATLLMSRKINILHNAVIVGKKYDNLKTEYEKIGR